MAPPQNSLRSADTPSPRFTYSFSHYWRDLVRGLIKYLVHPRRQKTAVTWDDLLIEHNVALLAHRPSRGDRDLLTSLRTGSAVHEFFAQLINIYLIIIVLLVIDAGLNFAPSGIALPRARPPGKSFTQATKLVINLFGLIFILSAVLDKSPIILFSDQGAATAVLLLVFRDAILGLNCRLPALDQQHGHRRRLGRRCLHQTATSSTSS